ncbi:hypothetical protein C5E07_02240 [Pseudoclavibacter sp. RFBJ3]|uniref:helix-turn-helix domain-containing protein n=1 Tax=unclassified Pseudoclavibacter TaxID=2615177 RepID=UPI000CE851C0|nr:MULTISPECIES: AraC family transcriptional regulator [unclassified Pseudoclavibacter]PPF81992.1 hypothetical protein C5C12_13320 [Pseudoclavibacter sp. RFBJ5]PPF94742.1 hypothetical protein C5E07_02240 [Pseudoclavibacter sp. RFBJ3]PPF95966.1 hypothetical protein C5C19_16945 [Pseudoclavibacter sp. RFBH5]PPG21258.1 hypothetical protein C5E13_13600 [Pseudoclavibacter sp. RFBI4]
MTGVISELDVALRGERAVDWLQSRGLQVVSADGEVKIFADLATCPTIVIGRIWVTPMVVQIKPRPQDDNGLVFLSFAMRGTSRLNGQNESEGSVPSPFYVHESSEPMRVESSDASTRLLFGIRRSKIKAVLGNELNYTGPRTPNAHLRKVLTSAAMASLDGSIDEDNPGFPAWRTAIENLVIAVLRSSIRESTVAGPSKTLLMRAHRLIAEQAHDANFSVVDLGQQLGISQSHLHRVFRETGTTPARLLRETRLALAEDFLGTGDPTVQDLKAAAAYSGFRNLRMFRRASAEESGQAEAQTGGVQGAQPTSEDGPESASEDASENASGSALV